MDAGSNVKRGAGSMPPPAPPPRHRGTDDLRKQALGGLLSAMGPSAPTAAPSPPTEAPQGHGPPGLLRRLSSDATPIDPDAWKQFWDERREVDLPDRGGAFNVYIAGSTGPILLLIHGAGYTGLTWSLEAAALKHRCRVVAPDLRGHGRTSAQPDTDYSKEMLAEDVVALWQALFSGPQTEGVVAAGGDPHATLIVGHSMGGAVAVWAAETKQIPSLAGCVVVDVVEGTALAALPHMGSVIAMRPTQFPSAEAAVSWALRSGMSRCKAAARVSIPSQLTRSGARLPAAPAPSTQATLPGTTKSTVVKAPGQSMRGPEAVITEVDEEGEGEDEGHRDEQAAAVEESVQSLSQAGDQGSAQASRPPTTPPAALESQGIVDASSASAGTAAGEPAGGSSSSGDAIPGAATAWVWRTSLAATQPFWEGWYTGLSDAFLALPMPKMLLLAGTDRLDKPLTIGQMQGKFQLVMLPMAGHAIQEDDATATSAALDSFMQRQRIGQPPMAAHLGPNGGRMQHFINSKGLKIMANYWPAIGDAPPRAVVHALHGHGAYLCFDMLKNNGPGKFCTYAGSWVEALNKAGYSVCGIDNQGAGRSEGLRCYADSFDAYVSDIVRHMDEAAALGTPAFAPDLPRFLLGGSLGGCLATMAALRKENRVAGIILLAPMLSLEKLAQRGINWLLRYIAPVVSTLVPTWAVVSTSRNTLYPDLQLVYDLDPNCWHGNTRARNGSEYVRTCAWLMAGGLELVTCPFLVFHGLKDDMCDLDGSRALYDRAKSTDKTLRLLDHMWHTLMKEPGNTGLLADVIEWLDKRAGPSDRPPNTSLVSELRVQAQASLAQASIPEPSVGKELSVDGAAHGGAVEVHATAA